MFFHSCRWAKGLFTDSVSEVGPQLPVVLLLILKIVGRREMFHNLLCC